MTFLSEPISHNRRINLQIIRALPGWCGLPWKEGAMIFLPINIYKRKADEYHLGILGRRFLHWGKFWLILKAPSKSKILSSSSFFFPLQLPFLSPHKFCFKYRPCAFLEEYLNIAYRGVDNKTQYKENKEIEACEKRKI